MAAAGGGGAGGLLIQHNQVIAGVIIIAALVIGLVIANVIFGAGEFIQQRFASALGLPQENITLISSADVKGLLSSSYIMLVVAGLAAFIGLMIYYLFRAVRATEAAATGSF